MSRTPETSEREQEAECGREGVTARTGSLEGSRQAVSEPGPLPGATSPAGRPSKSSGEARIQPAECISRNRLEGLVPPMCKGCNAYIQAGPLGEVQSREMGSSFSGQTSGPGEERNPGVAASPLQGAMAH